MLLPDSSSGVYPPTPYRMSDTDSNHQPPVLKKTAAWFRRQRCRTAAKQLAHQIKRDAEAVKEHTAASKSSKPQKTGINKSQPFLILSRPALTLPQCTAKHDNSADVVMVDAQHGPTEAPRLPSNIKQHSDPSTC